ncbi:unnamed protein product [Protopolystoma xenopodis]|uniref:Uncharacterized protein n=1 Tax=Protopolystoma xenopodis TaxID=117903 RepID=A0A448XMB8_9PLAT|nr:unnamed protein product [Protopolystoma xenopodis]
MSKSQTDYEQHSSPSQILDLRSAICQPDICPSADRLVLRLFLPVARTRVPLTSVLSPSSPLSSTELAGEENRTGDLDADAGEVDARAVAGYGGLLTSGFVGRLRRRASLLSLTSLGFVASAGLAGGTACLAAGLMSEIHVKLADVKEFAAWAAALRIAVDFSTETKLRAHTCKELACLYLRTDTIISLL